MKHTPGPWIATKSYNFTGTYVAYINKQQDSRDQAIAQTRALTRESSDANAALLAASPELYEELVEADEVICELCKRLNPQHKECTECQDRESRLKVIAKAKGGE